MIAQATPTTFAEQIPPELFLLIGGGFLLLIALILVFVLIRQQRSKAQKSLTSTETLAPVRREQQAPTPAATSPATDDILDIDALLKMTDASRSTTSSSSESIGGIRQPGIVDVRLTNGGKVEAAEMLILLRERRSDKLIVQIGDYAYTGAEGDIDPAFRRRFVDLMKELSSVAPNLSGRKATPIKRSGSTTATTSTPADQPAEAATGTLASQIEAHLQARLRRTGAFARRSIHVKDAADGGVRIEVDGQRFASVGDVSDPEVKKFIQETVAEWQEQQ